MVQQQAKPVIEEIEAKLSFDKELILLVYGYFLDFSDSVHFTSGGYEYESLEDFENNIGLFNFNNWKINNFTSSGWDASSVEYDGKKIKIYSSNMNSPVQQNLKGRVKDLVTKNKQPEKSVTQLITQTAIKGSAEEGQLSFFQTNKHTLKTVSITILSTVVSGLILFYVFNIG